MGRKDKAPYEEEAGGEEVEYKMAAKRTLRAANPSDIMEFQRWAKKILKKRGAWPSRYQSETFAKMRGLSQLWGRQQFNALDDSHKRRRAVASVQKN
jgi:hypothetical protein